MANPKSQPTNLVKDGELVAQKSNVNLPAGFEEPTIARPEYLYTSARGGSIVARIALPIGPVVVDTAVWKGKDGKVSIRLPQYIACKSDDVMIALDKALRDRLAIWARTAPPMPTQTRGSSTGAAAEASIDGL